MNLWPWGCPQRPGGAHSLSPGPFNEDIEVVVNNINLVINPILVIQVEFILIRKRRILV